MTVQAQARIEVLFTCARRYATSCREAQQKIFPLIGFVRGDVLVGLLAVASGSDDDVAFACAVGSVGYQADGVFLLKEGIAATTTINPLTGSPWHEGEMENVLHLDGGLGVIEHTLSLAYLERGRPLEMLTQEFAHAGDGLFWKDMFVDVESEGLTVHGDVPDVLRASLEQPARESRARRAIARLDRETLVFSLQPDGVAQRDRATTALMRRRGIVSGWQPELQALTLPGGASTPFD